MGEGLGLQVRVEGMKNERLLVEFCAPVYLVVSLILLLEVLASLDKGIEAGHPQPSRLAQVAVAHSVRSLFPP